MTQRQRGTPIERLNGDRESQITRGVNGHGTAYTQREEPEGGWDVVALVAWRGAEVVGVLPLVARRLKRGSAELVLIRREFERQHKNARVVVE